MSQEEKDIQDVMHKLSVLAPGPQEVSLPAAQALARLRPRLRPASGSWLARLWSFPNRQMVTAVAAFLLLLGLLFAFPAVRTIASDFLGLFRVQKFAAISISPQQLALLRRIEQEGIMPGQVELLRQPDPTVAIATLDEAARRANLPHPLTIARRGAPDTIFVLDGGAARLTIDLAGLRALLQTAGGDPTLLPDSLDGAQINVTVYPGIEQDWADGLWFLQMPIPLVQYPDGLDPLPMAQAMLQALGMSPSEAERLSGTIDWTSTLLIPIPADIATFNEVSIEDSSGLALSSLDGQNGVLIWQQADVIYVLAGPMNTADLLSLTHSLR